MGADMTADQTAELRQAEPEPGTAGVVAVIGLGAMGLPMALRLAADGAAVTGFDPVAERRDTATAGGVTAVGSVAEAARDADIVVLSVRDGAQAEQALFDGGETPVVRPGSVVVLTSTVGAPAARALAQRLGEHGVALVDAPVSGGPRRAGEGDLLILVGGATADVDRARPVLDALASTLTLVGARPGDGQLVKVINQLLAGVHIAAAAEAVALASAAGLDPSLVVDTLSAGAAGSFMLADRGPRIVEALTGDPEVRSRVDIFVKDMGLVGQLAAEHHVPAPVSAASAQLYLLAERAGGGADDDSTIVRLLALRSAPASPSSPSPSVKERA